RLAGNAGRPAGHPRHRNRRDPDRLCRTGRHPTRAGGPLMRLIVRLVVLLIVLALIAGLALWFLPASFAYRQFGDRLGASVVLQDLSGTVREGRAGQVLVNGFPVGAFEWTLDWRGLLRRDVGAQWRLRGPAWKAA